MLDAVRKTYQGQVKLLGVLPIFNVWDHAVRIHGHGGRSRTGLGGVRRGGSRGWTRQAQGVPGRLWRRLVRRRSERRPRGKA